MNYSHLTPDTAELMQASREERIEFCKQDRWVAYPKAREFVGMLDDLYNHPRTIRMPNYLLVARSGNGKSSILEHFARRYPSDVDAGGMPVLPVLHVEVPPDPTESSFYSAILWKMMRGHRERDSVTAKRQQTVAMLRQFQVRMLLLDEFNNIAEAGRSTRDLLATVRFLANDVKLGICAAGTATAINALNQDPQLKSRFQGYALPAWKLDRAYLQFLAAYEQVLPLALPSGLATREMATKLYALCGEAIGESVKLLKLAAAQAVRSGEERITVETLESVHWVAPTKWSDVAALI